MSNFFLPPPSLSLSINITQVDYTSSTRIFLFDVEEEEEEENQEENRLVTHASFLFSLTRTLTLTAFCHLVPEAKGNNERAGRGRAGPRQENQLPDELFPDAR